MTASLPNHVALTSQRRVLVLVDDASVKNSTSKFFDGLDSEGYKIKFRKVSEGSLITLKTNGEFDFDHLVLLFTSSLQCKDQSVTNVLEFVDAGGNLLLASSGNSPFASQVASECGITMGTSPVKDRFQSGGNFLQIAASWPNSALNVFPVVRNDKVKFQGTTSTPTKEALEMGAMTVLSGTLTTVAKDQFGSSVSLVSSVQMKNNARVSVSGSVLLFTNEFENLNFVNDLAKWTFAEQGVLRVVSWAHRKQDGSSFVLQKSQKSAMAHKNLPRSHFPDPEWGPNSKIYRIKDEVEYLLEMQVLTQGSWKPFNASDVQLEFAMLDAYQRSTFVQTQPGKFLAKFMLPDQYGTFAFRVVYNRRGLSSIRLLDSVNVRPFHHDEYERFIPNAYPYYTVVGVLMLGFLVFSCAFAYIPKERKKAD